MGLDVTDGLGNKLGPIADKLTTALGKTVDQLTMDEQVALTTFKEDIVTILEGEAKIIRDAESPLILKIDEALERLDNLTNLLSQVLKGGIQASTDVQFKGVPK